MSPKQIDIQTDVSVETEIWKDQVSDINSFCQDIAKETVLTSWPGPFTAHMGDISDIEISIVLSNNSAVQNLNRDYRGKDKPTNVLSFAALENDPKMAPPPGMPLLLGDIVIAYETAASEATNENKSLVNHLSHLVIHGILHLLGYDHQTDDEAQLMEKLEISILAGLSIESPYQTPLL